MPHWLWSAAVQVIVYAGAIVVLFTALGFYQEYRAEQAIAALRRMAVPSARVTRAGRMTSIPVGELVPGDIVLVESVQAAEKAVAQLTKERVLGFLAIRRDGFLDEIERVAVASGVFDGDEFEDLADAFNTMARSIRTSRGETNRMASPVRPARPVRPIRWT